MEINEQVAASTDGESPMTAIPPFETLETLRQLKASYFRLLDTRQWDAWGEVFTVDAVMDMPEAELHCEGRAEIVGRVREIFTGAITVHHGHTPEIKLIDAEHAEGIWAMEDFLIWPPQQGETAAVRTSRGYGHYYERYVLDEGVWRIEYTTLDRLYSGYETQYRSVRHGGS